MRHIAGFFSSIFLLVGPSLVGAQLFSEGGNNAWPSNKQQQQEPLTGIVDELNALRNLQQQYEADQLYGQQLGQVDNSYEQQQPQYFDNEADQEPNSLELAKIGADIQNLLKQQQQDEELSGQPEQQPVEQPKPIEPKAVDQQQKRGQNEFVEFVEPHAKALKNVEYMDKRAPISSVGAGESDVNYLYYSSNNVLFIVAVTVCSVFVITGVVAGAYHVNNIRKQRADAFDDFTRYSPAGPGRDVLRRGRGFAGSPIADSGDDALAKAAHLHHYEQTKQKIIGSDNGINNDNDNSDEEAEDLDREHNFSIYECPGLALSGDIEVKNPTFDKFEQQNP